MTQANQGPEGNQTSVATRAQLVVYLIGIALIGYFYEPLRAALGSDSLFAVVAVFSLVVLRLVGRFVQWLLQRRTTP
jgi:hypothetical protein